MSDRSDELYMKDPAAKSVTGFIEALRILSKYMKDGESTTFFSGAEHDVIYFYTEGPDEESPEGDKLTGLGFHWDEDTEGWAYFT
jgi:hypothetical protein